MPSASSQAVTVSMIGLVMTPPQSVITPRSGRAGPGWGASDELSATSVSDTASMLSHAPQPPGTRRPSVMAGPLVRL